MRALVFALFALLSAFQLAVAEPVRDGPYLTPAAEGHWTARWIEDQQVKQQTVRTGESIAVPAVGAVPEFTVSVRKPAAPAPDEIKVSTQTPLFIVADSHGQYELFVQLLQNNGVIDRTLRWAFRNGHITILGDVFDRGPQQTEILWLIYKLEDEARRAGGGVHFVLGNHEVMVMSGDLRYLHPKYPNVAQTLQAPTYAALWSEQTLLGQWLRTKASVIKLGEYLCLHGGISRAVTDSKLPLAEINRILRRPESDRERATLLQGPQGPLWYRGYFPEAAREIASDEDVQAALGLYGAKTIVVGHTIVPTITSLYGGKVIAVQVALLAEALRIEKGQLLRARAAGPPQPM